MIKIVDKLNEKSNLLIRLVIHMGFWNAIKSFVYINMQKRWGRKVYYIKHKKLGSSKFYLRSCSTDDYIANSILGPNGGYDFLPLMKDFLDSCQNIIDGGANIGIFSRMVTQINPKIKIIAVELEKTNYELLTRNVAGKNNIMPLMGGIWNANEPLAIEGHIEGNEAGFAAKRAVGKNSEAQGYTIDQIMNENGMDYIDILKLDIEGSEIEVFDDSSEKWIDKTKVIIIELHDRYRMGCSVAVYSRMEAHGFRCTQYGENIIFYKNKRDIGNINI